MDTGKFDISGWSEGDALLGFSRSTSDSMGGRIARGLLDGLKGEPAMERPGTGTRVRLDVPSIRADGR